MIQISLVSRIPHIVINIFETRETADKQLIVKE